MGSNFAECHPVGFRWVMKAKERGCKVLHIDPRFTRTAATADLFLQIRAGSDIAFLGGLINYAIENGRIARDYVLHYTNAAFIVDDGFKLADDGFFSGFDAAEQTYDKATWNYESAVGSGASNVGPALAGLLQPRRLCPHASRSIRRCSIPARSSNFSSSIIRATRRRWSSASRASRRISS